MLMAVKGPYHHVDLLSQDPRATAQWYVQHLGGRISQEAHVRGSMRVRLHLGDAQLNIRAPRLGDTLVTPKKGKFVGIDHFALSADELDGMISKLEKNGVKIVEPIFTTPDGGRAFFIEGPDRVGIEIIEIPLTLE